MEPREPSQPWPPGEVPVPAWTKTIAGAAYTIKRIDGNVFGIWRDVEELGTFELDDAAPDGFRSADPQGLSLEARTAVKELIATAAQVPEGPATRIPP